MIDLPQLLAGEPEKDIFFTVFALEELPEHFPSGHVPHQLVKGLAPTPNLVEGRPATIKISQPNANKEQKKSKMDSGNSNYGSHSQWFQIERKGSTPARRTTQ